MRLSSIDDANIGDHTHLRADDQCFFIYEYTSGKNYSFSSTNNLISNLKKKPTSNEAVLSHKRRAIRQCAADLKAVLNPDWLAKATIVPVPPSKAVGHPDYDPRMDQVGRKIQEGADVRCLVAQTASTVAAHEEGSGDRVTVDDLLAIYEIDEALAQPTPTAIAILDDVLTAGTHFRAMKIVLAARFPQSPIIGLFIARRVFPPDRFANMFEEVDF